MKAINASKSLVIASDLIEVGSFVSRLKGLIGRAGLEKGEGLWMARCRAIHTFGMRFPIDVIFLGEDMTVKRTSKRVVPFRIAACTSAAGVIELPEGTIERAQIRVGNQIVILQDLS